MIQKLHPWKNNITLHLNVKFTSELTHFQLLALLHEENMHTMKARLLMQDTQSFISTYQLSNFGKWSEQLQSVSNCCFLFLNKV